MVQWEKLKSAEWLTVKGKTACCRSKKPVKPLNAAYCRIKIWQ
jgi:hypothetical protein